MSIVCVLVKKYSYVSVSCLKKVDWVTGVLLMADGERDSLAWKCRTSSNCSKVVELLCVWLGVVASTCNPSPLGPEAGGPKFESRVSNLVTLQDNQNKNKQD